PRPWTRRRYRERCRGCRAAVSGARSYRPSIGAQPQGGRGERLRVGAERNRAHHHLERRQRLGEPRIALAHHVVELDEVPRDTAARVAMLGEERHRETGSLQRGDETRTAQLAAELERDEAAIAAGGLGVAMADRERVETAIAARAAAPGKRQPRDD